MSDGSTRDILSREFGTLYGAFAAGKDASLPDLPVQYADFAAWQRHWLEGETLLTENAGAQPLEVVLIEPKNGRSL